MKNNEYESVEHIDSDLMRMFENAKRYNVPHSSIYKRALKLQHIQQVSPNTSSQLCGIFNRNLMYIFSVMCLDEEKGAFTERR